MSDCPVGVDAIIPDDRMFPSASLIGVHWVLTERVRASMGAAVLERLVELLAEDGRLFHTVDPLALAVSANRLR